MYNLFGTKWCNIFAGPLWSYAPVAQANEHQTTMKMPSKVCVSKLCSFNVYMIFKALVNVPALSERTIRRGVAASDFTLGTNIQVCM